MPANGVNPSVELSNCEFMTEEYQALVTEHENIMDELMSEGTDDPGVRALVAEVKTEITNIRAQVGFWRTEASFWRGEVNENKTELKDSNKLASGQ